MIKVSFNDIQIPVHVNDSAITVKPVPRSVAVFQHSSISIHRRTSELLLLQLIAVPSIMKPLMFLQLEQFRFCDLQRCYSSSIFFSACGHYHCCLDINSIPQSVADLQCCCNFSIYYIACYRCQGHGYCYTSAATAPTFVDLVSASFTVKHPDKASSCLCSRHSRSQQ